jgi:hypothetical protein
MKELALQKFSQLASSLGIARLTPGEAEAIVSLSRLAIDADRSVDGEELDLYDNLGDLICELAGLDADDVVEAEDRKPRGDDDRGVRIAAAVGKLTAAPARELAYAVAFMLTLADLAIQPEEDAYLSMLQDKLGISDDRQSEIAEDVSDALAPTT